MINVLVLLSFKGSLSKWQREGILSREIELYVALVRAGHAGRVGFFSYDPADAALLREGGVPADLCDRFSIVAPERAAPGGLAAITHSLNVRLLWKLARAGAFSIAKTNQISGGWTAVILRLFGLPLFARCGYVLSRRLWKNRAPHKAAAAALLELFLFNAARAISVSTEGARTAIRAMLPTRRDRIFVSPTFVNTETFSPGEWASRQDAAVFVGRLEPQKNVLNMIEACAKAGLNLAVVGEGSLRAAAVEKATAFDFPVTFTRRLQNREIADLFRRHRYFILASVQEGLPKVLIEAMASGMICIGTNIPGIADLIEDGRTGYLAPGLEPSAIESAIRRARADSDSHPAISATARAHVLQHHSIATYVARDAEAMRRTAGERAKS
jgi:glycosyltransferase involved in cell wall biosynthesis